MLETLSEANTKQWEPLARVCVVAALRTILALFLAREVREINMEAKEEREEEEQEKKEDKKKK